MAPIIPWIGGKRRLVDLLLSRFPPHSCYVEVFAGGAAVFFARHPAEVEVLNDVNGDLVWCLKSKHQIIELAARATDARMVSALLCHTKGFGS